MSTDSVFFTSLIKFLSYSSSTDSFTSLVEPYSQQSNVKYIGFLSNYHRRDYLFIVILTRT